MKHVKENDLAHGEFGKWLDKIGINDRMARKFMTVAREFEGKRTTSSEIGLEALYQIATLPPEAREAEHVTAKGETKTPDEMTVRELRELKRQLRQAEKQAEAERKERERLELENEELSNRRPKYIEIDKTPEDYERLRKENIEYRRKYGDGKVRVIDDEVREEFYREFSEELSNLVRKYGSIIFDGDRVREYANKDIEYAKKVNDFDDFWKQYVKTVLSDQIIINVEGI